MSQKQFQVRHNMPQVALQNTLQTSKAFGLRVSPINIIPLTTKADNNIHRRPILEDNHLDSNSKLGYEAHNKKLVPPLRKGLYSRANLDLDRKKELPSIEKLPKSAPNNLNARLHLKQGLRPHGMRIGEDNKHRKPPLRKCEDKENDDLSGLRSMIDKEGLSTQRELKIGSQDDVMTEVTSSDGQTMINEGLKTKLSLEGPDIKYNRKCRVGSRGQDNGSDLVEEDIFEDKTSRNEMDFTLAQLTPEKSGQRRELDTEDKEKPKKAQKSRRKDSILTNASTNSTRPESEVQISQPAPAGVQQHQQRVRGAFTREHIPLEDIKKKHEQKKVMREYLDTQLEEKKRFQAEEKARELEEQKREEERIKKESELLTVQGEVDPSALTFGRKRVAPPKKESISVQHSTVKRPVPRKRTEDDIQRVSNEADDEPFNLDIDNIEPFISEGAVGRKRILSGDGAKSKEPKADVKELLKENDFLWGENQKKGELIDILIRALKQTDIPLNPLLSPPARLQTEIPQDFKSNPSKPQQSYETPPLLSQYFSQPSFPAEELFLKTQNIPSTTNRKTRPYEYPTGFPAEDHKKIPDLTGFPMHTSKPFLPPHKPTVQKIQISLTRESQGYPPIKDLASPLRSPTLTNAILQPISVPTSSKVLLNNNYNSNKSNNNNHFYSHTRALTSPDEVLSVRMPLAQIPDHNNINYGMSGSTRRAEQMHGHYNKVGYGENGMGTKSISHAHETFSKTNMDISGGNILVLEDGLNFARQDSKQMDGEEGHLPSLKKAIRSEMNKDVEVEGLKALIPEFGRGKSSGALDQTARFPKEIFGINVKRKF